MIRKTNMIWAYFFFILGIISIFAQSVLLRELIVLFYGNELFYGLSLGVWMLSCGLGSFFALKLRPLRTIYLWLIQIGLVILLPFLIILLRFLTAKLIPQGYLPNMGWALIMMVITIFVYCFPLGILFTLGSRYLKKIKFIQPANKSYLWETAGFAIGGIIFTLFLSNTTFPLFNKVNFLTLRWRYLDISNSFNTKYEQIVISRSSNQDIYYRDGQLAFTNQQERNNQEFTNIALSFIKTPKKFLILGNPTLTNTINNSIENPDINFIEIDHDFLQYERQYMAKNTRVASIDPRSFLKNSLKNYDVVILYLGNPQTLLSNRYFTQEFLVEVKEKLTTSGILVMSIYLPTDYQSQEALLFGGSIYKTLSMVYPNVDLVTLEDQIIFVSANHTLFSDINNINSNWKKFVDYHLKDPQRSYILNNLSNVKVSVNTDKEPSAFFYQQLFWQTMFDFATPKLILSLSKYLPILLIFIIIFIITSSGQKQLGIFMASSSFTLMGLETIIIAMFQTKIGYLFSQISIIFALILTGIGSGIILTSFVKDKKFLLKLSIYGHLSIIALLLLLNYELFLQNPIFWFFLAYLIGIPTGIIYAVLNKFQTLSTAPGYLYAFDLFGSSIGAMLIASILLPVIGTNKLLLILGFILAINLVKIKSLFSATRQE